MGVYGNGSMVSACHVMTGVWRNRAHRSSDALPGDLKKTVLHRKGMRAEEALQDDLAIYRLV
jgi:hypothetical protein